MQVHFDPLRVSYNTLLDVFFSSHNPANMPYSRQYMSLILYDNQEQKEVAEKAIEQLQLRRGPIHTELAPLTHFFMAEGYHQKYYLRRVSVLINEVEGRYPTVLELVSSRLATRLNGYVSGYGTLGGLKQDLADFGLSEKAENKILTIVSSR